MLSPLKLYCKRNTLIQCAQPMHEAFHRITPMTIMPVMGYRLIAPVSLFVFSAGES